jgi:hypothetical protein
VLVVHLGILLVLLALGALLPVDRLPPWLNLYLGVTIASAILVVLALMLT